MKFVDEESLKIAFRECSGKNESDNNVSHSLLKYQSLFRSAQNETMCTTSGHILGQTGQLQELQKGGFHHGENSEGAQ